MALCPPEGRQILFIKKSQPNPELSRLDQYNFQKLIKTELSKDITEILEAEVLSRIVREVYRFKRNLRPSWKLKFKARRFLDRVMIILCSYYLPCRFINDLNVEVLNPSMIRLSCAETGKNDIERMILELLAQDLQTCLHTLYSVNIIGITEDEIRSTIRSWFGITGRDNETEKLSKIFLKFYTSFKLVPTMSSKKVAKSSRPRGYRDKGTLPPTDQLKPEEQVVYESPEELEERERRFKEEVEMINKQLLSFPLKALGDTSRLKVGPEKFWILERKRYYYMNDSTTDQVVFEKMKMYHQNQEQMNVLDAKRRNLTAEINQLNQQNKDLQKEIGILMTATQQKTES